MSSSTQGSGPPSSPSALDEHALPLGTSDAPTLLRDPSEVRTHRGRLVAVCGPGGTGASVIAAALADHLARDARHHGLIALADLARHADQAMLHDAREIAPGVLELVDAHRGGELPPDELRAGLHRLPRSGIDLLLGLRHHRDWTALRPRAVAALVDALVHAYAVVVIDTDPDVEGEADTGSADVEERNAMARSAFGHADLVLVVGNPGTKGVHALGRTIRLLLEAGAPPDRLLPVINRASRHPAERAAVTKALDTVVGAPIAGPVFVREQRRLESCLRDAAPWPGGLAGDLTRSVNALLAHLTARTAADATPEPVRPGSMGHWSEELSA